VNKFLELLWYVDYIREEKVQIQCFISGLPDSYKDKIEFVEPKTLNDEIHKARHCYEKDKNWSTEHHSRKETFGGKYDQQKKKKSSLLIIRTNPRMTSRDNRVKVEISKLNQ